MRERRSVITADSNPVQTAMVIGRITGKEYSSGHFKALKDGFTAGEDNPPEDSAEAAHKTPLKNCNAPTLGY